MSTQAQGKDWILYNDDCIEVMKQFPKESMDFSIFSPPFSSLYVFSDDIRDLSNCRSHREFFRQFKYCVKELYRVMKAGRLVAVHTMDLTTNIGNNGFLSTIDFSGMVIRLFQRCGFYFHVPITIPKDPVVEVTRTKNIQLLYKQFCKDATISRPCFSDRLLIFRKPGENKVPVTHDKAEISPNEWGVLAQPVWGDIRQSNTLNSLKEDGDEKHISCLQLDVIERAIKLWTNKGEIVFSPFAGIGSEIYQAIKMDRKGIGIELKKIYYEQAIQNITAAENSKKQVSMFDNIGE